MAITERDRQEQVDGNGHLPQFVRQLVGPNFIEECRATLVDQRYIEAHQLKVLSKDEWTHPDSDALYFAEAESKAHRAWVSGIPPGSRWTSIHSHPGRDGEKGPVFERYEVRAGECDVWIEGRFEKLKAGQVFRVWPGQEHAVKTNGVGVVLLIVAENGGFYSREELHRNRRPAPFRK